MKLKIKVLLIALMLGFCATQLAYPTLADGNVTDIKLHLTGAEVLGTQKHGLYSGTLVDPLNRQWKYEVYVTAENVTGALPLEAAPTTGNLTATNKTFAFDVTAPVIPGELTIHVNISSADGNLWYEKTEIIDVVSPVIISTTIINESNIDVKNATVKFYIDDEEIDSQTIGAIPGGQSIDVSAEWITAEKSPGWHSSRIEVDINADGVIDQTLGDRVITDTFYVEGGTSWVLWLIILLGLVVLLLGIRSISKRKLK